MSLVCFAEYNICKHEVLIWFGSLFRSNNVLFKCVSFLFFYFFVVIFDCPFLTAGRQLPYDVQSWHPSFGPSSLQHHESWCFGPLHTQNQEAGPKKLMAPGLLQQELFLLKTSMFRCNLSLQGFKGIMIIC